MTREDPRLRRLTEITEALPETARELSGRHAIFRVRKKTFAYFLDDHHGDGIVGVSLKVPDGEAEVLMSANPDRFYRPSYTRKGWIGLRLDSGNPDWELVSELVTDSYVATAPKRLAATVGDR